MYKLCADILDKNTILLSESEDLLTLNSEEFIPELVFLCNKLCIDIPVWTSSEEKLLRKNKVVFIELDKCGDLRLRISIKEN